jgi:ribosome-binding factor A
MRQAVVHVSIMGEEAKQRRCLHGLQHSAGYLQSKIAERIDTRYTPRLRFELDLGVKKSLEISRLLNELLPSEEAARSGDDEVADEPRASLDDG